MKRNSKDILVRLKEQQKKLVAEIAHKSSELKQVNRAIAALDAGSLTHNKWTTTAMGCLLNNQRIMTTAEILDCLYVDREHELLDKEKRRVLMTGLSVALGNMCESQQVFKLAIPGQRGYSYGIPEWLEKDGKTVKPKYIDYQLLQS